MIATNYVVADNGSKLEQVDYALSQTAGVRRFTDDSYDIGMLGVVMSVPGTWWMDIKRVWLKLAFLAPGRVELAPAASAN